MAILGKILGIVIAIGLVALAVTSIISLVKVVVKYVQRKRAEKTKIAQKGGNKVDGCDSDRDYQNNY